MRHNAYLYQGFKQFTANVKTASHCFFIFGHSLATNDDHILNRIARGKFRKLCVGIYGEPASAHNQRIMNHANELAVQRNEKSPLDVVFYDAATVHVWGLGLEAE
ncbi:MULTISPECIES: DUF4917 family protein [unclassified Mesorhizobium]|uniref:DUF4917 family protein n=1 Tax=unclassified Mesorhizobium TaxID=325217 RepID=UPI003337D6DE